MAIAVKPKRKFTTGTPTTSDIVEGEIAVNTADQKIWMRDNSNNIVQVGGVGGGTSVTISETAPGSPSAGDLWWDSTDDDANLKIYYTDGTPTSQWVTAAVTGGGVSGSNTQIQFNSSNNFGASSGLTWDGTSLYATNIKISDGGNIGSSSDADAIAIAADGKTTFSQQATFSNGIKFADNGTISTTTTSALITFLDDNVRIQNSSTDDAEAMLQLYSEDTGTGSGPDMLFWRNSSSPADSDYLGKIIFAGENDADEIITYSSIYAQAVDVSDSTEDGRIILSTLRTGANANYAMGSNGVRVTFQIPSDSYIGSSGDSDSIKIDANGIVTMNQIPVFEAGINVSGGTIAGTLATAAQTNITSLGTLTALTVDDVAIDGKVITMTGSTDDTFTITAATNGATTIATVDTNAAVGHISIVPDGEFQVDAAGKIVLDAGNTGGFTEFHDSGTVYGSISQDSNDMRIRSGINNGDVIIQGLDGSGGLVTSVEFDMSDSGTPMFHSDIKLNKDGNIIKFGANWEITLTHVHNSGLTLTNTVYDDNTPIIFQLKSEENIVEAGEVIASIEMAAGDVSGTDAATVAAGIHAIAEGEFTATANPTKLVFTTGVSETAAASATAKMTLSSAGLLTIADDFIIKDSGTIGSASDPDALTIAADGDLTLSQDLHVEGTITLPNDGALLSFGADGEISLTHVADTGLSLTDSGGTPTLQLHDSNESISSDGTNLILTSGGTAFKLPTADGSNNHVLKTDGAGNLSFVAQSGGGSMSDVVDDTTPQLGGNLDMNSKDIITTSNGDIDLDPDGSGVVVFKGNATKGSGQFKLNCENNSHAITIKGPPHSAAAAYTLVLPNDDGSANQVLKTDGSGVLSWVDQSGGGGGGGITTGKAIAMAMVFG